MVHNPGGINTQARKCMQLGIQGIILQHNQLGGLSIQYYTPTTNESIVGHKIHSVIIVH